VIGGGETGATVAISLLKETKADVQIDLINRRGTIYSRGESYRENRLFSEPATWVVLDEELRSEFLQRTDRGVFSPAASAKIDQSPRVNTLLLEIKRFGGDGESAYLQYVDKVSPTGERRARYQRIVMALPFNPAAPLLSMLPKRFRPRLKPEGDVKNLTMMRGIDWYLRLDLADVAADAGRRLNIHVPMLAGLRQGPGFPNLSCLGLLSDRILSAYTDTEDAETKPG
jgi:mycobactin lysine-N-oxygenase